MIKVPKFPMSVKNAIHQKFMAMVTPYKKVPHKSTLLTDGKITPEEFLAAGDTLVSLCPQWNWSGADEPVAYLPKDKQYLINRGIVCTSRASEFAEVMNGKEVEDDWEIAGESAAVQETVDLEKEEEEVVDLDDLDIDSVEPEFNREEEKTNPKARIYTITICYDNFYNTSHVYLYGVNSEGKPLSLEEMYQDISADHAKTTVTYENHPYINQKYLSIHPCQHSHVMNNLIAMSEHPDEFCAPMYYFLFLKFIHTVIPTIDVSTPSIELSGNK